MEEIRKIILRQFLGTTTSSAVKLAFDKLFSCLQNRLGSSLGDGDDLTKIKSSLDTIQSVIVSAEERPLKDQALLNWLEKLKDAAYDAEDVLDEYTTEDLRRKVEAQNSNSDRDPVTNKVRKIASSISIIPVPNRTKMTLKLKEIRKRLQIIEEESLKFKLSKRVENWDSDFKKHRVTNEFGDGSRVYGRAKEREKIVNQLLHPVASHEDENVSVIPIVGMGGVGKTTLAQLVFNDHRVRNHFELKMWVCVSDDFDVRKLMEKIVRRATDTDSKLSDLDLEALRHRVREALTGRRFLLVLDDVWNEKAEEWNSLRVLLMCGGIGSRIVVTTRNPMVATIMSRIKPHDLEGLSEGDCWKLFASRAFLDDREGDHPKLVEIGKDIVSKCRGVPLALITLGSLLSFKRNEGEWVFVRDSELWNLAAEDVSAILPTEYVRAILASLMLSYYHLNPQLRPCFVFCAIFPKDYNIGKELLIQLWMAHGCVPSIGGMELEDIGISILNELLTRSLFQEVKEYDGGDSSKVKVHDLVHDLAQSVMRNDCCIIQPGTSVKISEKVRHLSCFQTSETLPNFLREAHESLRTFFVLYLDYFEAPQFMPGFKFLRVLHLGLATDIEQPLPTSLGELIHLRYLGFSTNAIRTLPESIGNLLNLQTLSLSGCYSLGALPRATRNLISLRCLDIDHCESLSHMPPKIGMLSCLRNLPLFVVGDGAGDCSGIEELQYLKQLKGNLLIKHLELVAIPSNAQQANLIGKQNLVTLQLCWRDAFRGGGDIKIEAEEEVLKALQPHTNLKKLKIFRYGGIHFPDWMTGLRLPSIEKITLGSCKKCEILPPLGQLPSLKYLYIFSMDRVEKIRSEFFGNDISEGFPKLKELEISDMGSLKIWSGLHGKRVFPSLQILRIINCINLKSLPEEIGNLSSLKELELDRVGLTSLPESMQGLSTLKKLEILNCHQLASLPEGIGKLPSLENLSLWFCGLTSLPEGIGNLSSLKELCLDGLRLTSLPEWIRNLSSLKQLELHNVDLTSLPEGIGNLQSLQQLELHNVDLISLPEGIGNLSSLKQLELHNVGLTSLPESMKALSTLQELSIKSCPQLPSLPEWVRNLIALQLLTIEDCPQMLSLPLGFHRLTGLRRLSITKCPELRRRCEKTGQDFHKIQHIPEVNFWS